MLKLFDKLFKTLNEPINSKKTKPAPRKPLSIPGTLYSAKPMTSENNTQPAQPADSTPVVNVKMLGK